MKTNQMITSIFMAVIVGVVIVYDIIIAIEPTPGDTISEVSLYSMRQWPVIFHAFGAILGHIAWPSEWQSFRGYRIACLAGYMLAFFLADLFWIDVPNLLPIVWLVAGIPLGHFGWPQKMPKSSGE